MSVARVQQRIDQGPIIKYLSKYQILVCVDCRYAINASPGISNHLRTAHKWPRKEATKVDQEFLNVGPISSPSDKEATWLISKPEDPSIPYLPVYHDGF